MSLQFQSEANGQDIISDITFLLGANLAANFKINDRVRSVNEWMNTVWTWIFESYGGWQFMDDNTSGVTGNVTSGTNDGPFADQTLTSGTGLYGLPTGTLTVVGVQMKTVSGGPLTPLVPITYEEFLDRGGDGSFPSTGVPRFYILQGDIIRLLPVPNFTLAASLRVVFDQGMSGFTPSDTTKVPGFAGVFHRILSIGASLDYAMFRGTKNQVSDLTSLRNDYERRIKSFYGKRFKARFPQRMNPGEDLVDEFS